MWFCILEINDCLYAELYCYTEVKNMSIEAKKKLNAVGIKCSVLTKGILPVELAELSKENGYGITLISLDEDFCIII